MVVSMLECYYCFTQNTITNGIKKERTSNIVGDNKIIKRKRIIYLDIGPLIAVFFLRLRNLKHLKKMRAGILTLHHLEMQGKCKKNASTQKDKANLVSRQDRLDLFSDSMFHLENLDH